jgi:hypothetical protein
MLQKWKTSGGDAFPIKPMSALADEPPINWLIASWIAAREFACFWGDPGAFKSFVAQGLSLQLAARRKAKVVYVAAEGSTGLAARVHAWNALNYGDPYRDDPNWFYMPSNVDMTDTGAMATFNNKLNDVAGEPDLIVLDTLARNFFGDENSAKDMGRFIEGVEELRHVNQSAVWVVHHANVSQENRRERGNSALRAATFAMYKCSDPRKTRDGASFRFECDRMKDGEAPEPVRIDLTAVPLDVRDTGEVYRDSLAMRRFPKYTRTIEDSDTKETKLNEEDRDLMKLVKQNGGAITGSELAAATGEPTRDCNKKLWSLVHRGQLEKHDNGEYTVKS